MIHKGFLRHRLRLCLITFLLASFGFSAMATADPVKSAKAPEAWKAEIDGPLGAKLRLELYNRLRGEFIDWFGDPIVNGRVVDRESSYSYFANKFQLGLRVTGKPFEAFVQFQDSLIAALPTNGIGLGSMYFANTPESTQNGSFLRQGWLKLKHEGFYVSGGRQLFSDSASGAANHKSLKWIKDYRLSARLIGPFDFTHVGRSFDGGTLGYVSDDIEVSGFAFMPTFGGFEINGMKTISDIHVAGAAFNLRDSERFKDTIAQLSYYYYDDARELVATDNRAVAARSLARGQSLELHTFGISAAHIFPLGAGLFDAMAYGYGQLGDWQNLDHEAWAFGAEFGYQLPELWASPWLRAGINSASGDSYANDHRHQTFFQMLPTVWLYAQFPFYNMMNNQDVFVQALLKPHPMVNVRLDFHWLSVNERSDLVYTGAGATSDTFFGYGGTPTGGFRNLAYLTHLNVNIKANDYLSFNIFYAHAFGQNVIQSQYNNDQGNFGFVETILAF